MHLVSLFVLAGVLAAPVPAQDTGTEERALRELWVRFEEAFNQFDAAKVSGLYAEDGDRINGDFELARGRAEIAKQYEADFTRRRADPTTQPLQATLSIRLLGPEVAVLDGEWDGLRSGKKVRGYFTVIASKKAGRWEIASGRVRGMKER